MGALVDSKSGAANFEEGKQKGLHKSKWVWIDDNISNASTVTTEESSFKSVSENTEDSYDPVLRIIPSVLTPSVLDRIDDMLLYSCYRDTALSKEKTYHYGSGQNAVVKVAATTLPRRKSRSKSDYMEFMDIKSLQKSISTFVGEIHMTNQLPSDTSLKPGTMVTSMHKCPVDASFLSLPVESLIALPTSLDPGESASIVATYLPAFAILHHGCSVRENRYSVSSLKMQSILIVGGDSTEQEALVKIAFLGEARKVTVLNTNRDFPALKKKRFKNSNLVVLEGNPDSELRKLYGTMNVVIDLDFPKSFHFVRACIKPNGRFVARKNEKMNQETLVSGICSILDQAALFMMESAYLSAGDFKSPHVLFFSIRKQTKRDLNFLFRLVSLRKIRPNVNKYIARKDIPRITEEMRKIACMMKH
eukprot:scaffold22568_cov125-Cylindrotheca_fusiformis.AAC.19